MFRKFIFLGLFMNKLNFWIRMKEYFMLYILYIKGVLHLLPKISMFCTLSQNNQQPFEKKVCI